MAVCEKCGTTFEPKQSGVVKTLRILCPPCAEARAREKALGGTAAAVGSPVRATVTSAPALKAVAPAPVKRPVRTKREEPEPEADDDDPKRSEKHAKAEKVKAGHRSRGLSTAAIGWIAAGLVVLGSGVALYVILSKKKAVDDAVEAYEAKTTGIRDRIKALSAEGTEKAHQELLAFAAENEATWKDSDFAADITTLVAKSKNQLEKARKARDLESAMATVEGGLSGVEQASPAEIAELSRTLTDVEPQAEGQGADFVARVGRARTVLDRAYSTALHNVAKSFADANPDKGRQALQHYTPAEDEVIRMLDATTKARNTEAQVFFRDKYKELITESDALVNASFTPEVIDQLPWKDLLSGDQAGKWNAATVKGFSHHLEAGTMTMIGPDADAGAQGLISIGDREQWRDFVVDMEFTLDSGSFDLYFRLGQRADGTVPNVNFTAGQDGLVAGKSYEVTGRMIGSQLEVTTYPEDVQTQSATLQWAMARKGGLGFSLAEGTRLKISRLKVRELRMSGK